MKIAIYGDSFADPRVRNGSLVNDSVAIGWPDIIAKHHQVVNYARGGTSIYYSYKKFLETYQSDSFDRIIFVLTDHLRWYHLLENKNKLSPCNDYFHAIPTPVMCDYWRTKSELKNSMSEPFRNQLAAIDAYFMDLKDEDFDKTICTLMIDDVRAKRPDTLFITGGTFPEYHTLVNTELSIAKFGLNWVKNWPEYANQIIGFLPWEERRTVCHLAKEVNEVVATEMLCAIDTRVWNPSIPELIKAEHKDFDYYYNVGGFNWVKRGNK